MTAKITLAEVAELTEETREIGKHKVARATAAFVATASLRGRAFAETEDGWVELCGRCAGAGIMTEYKGIHNGVCYGCNATGFKGAVYDTRAGLDEGMRRWGMAQRTAMKKAAEKAEIESARMEAKNLAWAEANPELVAQVKALTPDRVHEDGYEEFSSWAPRVRSLILKVREGSLLDAKETAFLKAVMARTVAEQDTARYAGEVGEKVAVTGVVKYTDVVDGKWGSQVFMIVEGTGADAGIVVKMYIKIGAATDVMVRSSVTVTGTVTKHTERAGLPQTTVNRAKVTLVAEPVAQELQEAPVAADTTQTPAKAPEAPQAAAQPVQEDTVSQTPAASVAHPVGTRVAYKDTPADQGTVSAVRTKEVRHTGRGGGFNTGVSYATTVLEARYQIAWDNGERDEDWYAASELTTAPEPETVQEDTVAQTPAAPQGPQKPAQAPVAAPQAREAAEAPAEAVKGAQRARKATGVRAQDISRMVAGPLAAAGLRKSATHGWTARASVGVGGAVDITLNFSLREHELEALGVIRERLEAGYTVTFIDRPDPDVYELMPEGLRGCSLVEVRRRPATT